MTVQQPRRQQPRSQSEAGWIILLVILAALLAAAWFQRDAIERLLG